MIHRTAIVPRYAETDQMGIVHHSVYPIWFEVARTEFIRQFGISYSELEKMDIMLPLAEVRCRFHGATHYEDQLTVESSVAVLTPARVEFSYRVSRDGEKSTLCTGATLHAFTDATLRPISLRKKHPEIYGLLLSTMEPSA